MHTAPSSPLPPRTTQHSCPLLPSSPHASGSEPQCAKRLGPGCLSSPPGPVAASLVALRWLH
eukprot:scaffold219482_cov35-Tisochrysis_lutea.AAC.4